MNVQRCSRIGLVGLTILFCLPHPVGYAQQTKRGDFKVNNIRQQQRRAPDYGGSGTTLGGQGMWSNQPWMYFEVDFSSDPEWADDVTLRFYVLMQYGRQNKMFTGEVTHVNVKKGSHHYSAMFMHPSTVERYGQGKVEAVAVRLEHQGRLMDEASDKPTKARWWETVTPVPGFLLKPLQTPWSVIAFTRFEAEKPAN